MDSLLFSLGTIGPVFLIIAIGVLLRRFGLIDPDIAGSMTRLVFHLFLPSLLLRALIKADFSSLLSLPLVCAVWGTLFLGFSLAWLGARLFGADRKTRGIFASGSTWGNVAIVGYALGEAIYGEAGLARAAIFSVLVLPLHTPMGFFAMDSHLAAADRKGFLPAMAGRLVRNPIIISVILGLVLNLTVHAASAEIPGFLMNVLDILARASLPLALVAIGGSLEFARDPAGWAEPSAASLVKLVIMPLIAYPMARIFGLDNGWIGTVILGFSCPTAVSFFVISRSLGYEGSRGAAIVTSTTLGSAITVGIIAIILKSIGLA